jgi:hypothetical protein
LFVDARTDVSVVPSATAGDHFSAFGAILDGISVAKLN